MPLPVAFLSRLAGIPDLGMHPLEYVLRQHRYPGTGLVLEFGVYAGASIRTIAHAYAEASIYGFDSFEGLPEAWGRPDMRFDKGAFAVDALPAVPANVSLVQGWFDATLPAFCAAHAGESIFLLHIDCDLYASTKCVLDALHAAGMLRGETLVVFDELINYPTYEEHEARALAEFLQAHPEYSIEFIGMNGVFVPDPVRDMGYHNQPVALRLRNGAAL